MSPDKRSEFVRNGIKKEQRGIEIAPWFRPLTPKNNGYNCLVLDVFSKKQLLERAINDINIPIENHKLLEEVDIVGSASEIAELVPETQHGTFDYVISSHNFEHLPNPLKFLQGCEKVLKSDGRLIMALPDQRACFDYFRPHTTVSDWIEALLEDRRKPNQKQLFEHGAFFSEYCKNSERIHAFSLYHSFDKITCSGNIVKEYKNWTQENHGDYYRDAHCTVMTPSSFELLIKECNILGLTNLKVQKISSTYACEFVVVLDIGSKDVFSKTPNIIEHERTKLMHRILEEKAIASAWGKYNQGGILFYLKGFFIQVLNKLKLLLSVNDKNQ